MNHLASITLRRPLVGQWPHQLAEILAGALRKRRERRDLERRIAAMADLGEAVLRDIGAGDLVHDAAARRQADAERLEALRVVANYRGVDSRFW